jgi:outer membrane immunogenic protein
MNKLILGTVALSAAGLVNAAFAADLPVKAPPIVPVVYNWTGCYIGANGGWKWGRFNESVDTAGGSILIPSVGLVPFAPGHVDLDHVTASSGAFGGQIGCRWENAEHWVFGAEADFDWTNLHATVINNSPNTTGLVAGDTFDNRMRWEGSGRVSLGRAFDRWLVYGTGGIAFARVDMTGNFIATTSGGVPIAAFSAGDSKTLVGGTVGLGAAYMLTKNWEFGAEYRYTFYAQSDYNLGTPTAFCATPPAIVAVLPPVCAGTTATGHKGLETQEVLLKLNYRFDWGGPVVAKY